MEKQFRGLLTISGERVGRNRVECSLGLGNLEKIAADEAGIGGMSRQRFSAKVEFDQVTGCVFTAEAEDGDIHVEVC
jgi:hypothetical protein